MGAPEGSMMHDDVSAAVLQVVVRAESEVVVLQLRRGIHPATLIAAERSLLVISGDDVLPELGPDPFQPEPRVADDRVVAQNGMTPLQEIVGGHRPDRCR